MNWDSEIGKEILVRLRTEVAWLMGKAEAEAAEKNIPVEKAELYSTSKLLDLVVDGIEMEQKGFA